MESCGSDATALVPLGNEAADKRPGGVRNSPGQKGVDLRIIREIISSFAEAFAYLIAIVLSIVTLALIFTGQVVAAIVSVGIIVAMYVCPKLWKRWRSQGDLAAEEM